MSEYNTDEVDIDTRPTAYVKPKVLVACPNYTNLVTSEVHANHIECSVEWKRLGIDYNWSIIGRTFIHFARSQACQAAIDGGFTHIFWVDDDAVIDPSILPRFLEHDKDIVVAPYPMRRFPHEIGVLYSVTGNFHQHNMYQNFTTADLDQGLVQVDGGGTHAMLVKTKVFHMHGNAEMGRSYPKEFSDFIESLTSEQRALAEQYVGAMPDESCSMLEESEKGKPFFMMPKTGTEDMLFCYRAKKKGAEVWCDTDVFAGHVGFYPVVNREHTEMAENYMRKQNDDSVSMSGLQAGTTPEDEDDKVLSGVRRHGMDPSRAASLA